MHETNSPYNVFPYGLGYLAAILLKAGHKVEIFDQATSHKSNKELEEFLKKEKPFDFIGVGFQAAYYHTVKEMCKSIKKARKEIPLILGGSAPSASPEFILKKFKADYIMMGECDLSILKFVDMIQNKIKPEEVPGLCWKEGRKIKKARRISPPMNLDELPFPAWELFDMKSYTFPMRLAGVNHLVRAFGILTSRGCPYACKFCFRIEKGYRMRSAESCLNEIRELIEKYNLNHVDFHDDLFMVNKKRTLDFCKEIKDSGLKFTWTCNGRFNIADREQLRAMKEAGCVEVAYGLESGDQKILDEMDKRIKVEQIREIAAITKEEGLLVSVPSMFGLPGETEESLNKTVKLIIETTTWQDKRTIRPMQPYPGCFYFDYCVEKGILKNEDDFFSRYFSSEEKTVNLTELSDLEFDKAMYKANKELLQEHYRHAYKNDMTIFKKIYFTKDIEGFIPMR